MNDTALAQYIVDNFAGTETTTSYGYTFFFFGSERKLPFATIASADNEHDSISNLDRPGVFRLNIGVSKKTFQSLFGKDRVDTASYDYTALDRVMPHPEYAAWNFICVLNPSEATMTEVKLFLAEAYDLARSRAGEAD